MTSPTPRASITPTLIAQHFFHGCARHLRYHTSPEGKEVKSKYSSTLGHILEEGRLWENQVLEEHLGELVDIADGQEERFFSLEESLERLRSAQPGRYLYQPTLRAPRSLYARMGIDPQRVHLKDNRPDLLHFMERREGRVRVRIIDIKRGSSARIVHKVQVLFYAMELDAIARDLDLPIEVDLVHGAVWLGGEEAPELFLMEDIRPHLEDFLKTELGEILMAPEEEVPWHIQSRCESCVFLDHCQTEACDTSSLSLITGISPGGKRFLEQEGVRTLESLGEWLQTEEAPERLRDCASLHGRGPILRAKLEAFEKERPVLSGNAAPGFPSSQRKEKVSLFMTLQQEPVREAIYLSGLYVQCTKNIGNALLRGRLRDLLFDSNQRSIPLVRLAPSPEEAAALELALIEDLSELLSLIERFNETSAAPLSIKIYLYSGRERTLLSELLLRGLESPQHAAMALRLLFFLQPPELVHAWEHPAELQAQPSLLVLSQLIEQLLALPVHSSYTLPETLATLRSKFEYRRSEVFHNPLSHGFRPDSAYEFWRAEDPERRTAKASSIIRQGEMHLRAVSNLLQLLRQKVSRQLVDGAAPLEIPPAQRLDDELLSRLSFIARYESVLDYFSLRALRGRPPEGLASKGHIASLTCRGGWIFEVSGGLLMDLESSTFPRHLLFASDREGRMAQLRYPDYERRAATPRELGGTAHVISVSIGQRLPEEGPAREIELKPQGYFHHFPPPEEGDQFFLVPRFTDFNTHKLVAAIAETAGLQASLFRELLHDPAEAGRAHPLQEDVHRHALSLVPELGLRASQERAFRGVAGHRLSAIWGPPGTGKTHFLATMILALAAAHARAGRPFKVLLTAFTHAAIENLCRKVVNLQEQLPFTRGLGVQVAKAKGWRGGHDPRILIIADQRAPDWIMSQDFCILGATVYSAYAMQSARYDLVVVDEASQLKVHEAATPFRQVSMGGRVVLTGDHLQLGPIFKGIYPEPRGRDPLLVNSIFGLATGQGWEPEDGSEPSSVPRFPLLDCFRMNDVLTGYAARLLYGPEYQCALDSVARQRIRLSDRGELSSPAVEACLDPDFPMVVASLEGGPSASRANPMEAGIVAELVAALRERLLEEDQPFSSDEDFFRDGVFVVSPHRAQIQSIQDALSQHRSWSCRPFVDTVDKMQGQEAQVALVSYGVSDPEAAENEAEFIYGRNRLNVAITRARAKSVVFLPAPLLQPSAELLDEPEVAEGLRYMRQMIALLLEEGEELYFPLSGGARLRVLRSATPPTAKEPAS